MFSAVCLLGFSVVFELERGFGESKLRTSGIRGDLD